MSEEKSELCLLDEAYIEEQKGLISDLECDVHFWKTKAEKAQAKLDAAKGLPVQTDPYTDHCYVWYDELMEAIGEQDE